MVDSDSGEEHVATNQKECEALVRYYYAGCATAGSIIGPLPVIFEEAWERSDKELRE